MTVLQEQAMDLIKRLPDEKIYYLINLLEDLAEPRQMEKRELTDAQKAYQNLQKFRRKGIEERDYKAELHVVKTEKFENI